MTADRQRPNIVLIMTDQQNFRMMSCAGNDFVRTPAVDSLAAYGVRFDRAYCTNPVCVPSRFSLFTGRYPSAIGQRSNPSRHLPDVPQSILDGGMGWPLREAGYETAYGGKVHLPKGIQPGDLGFDYITDDERDELADVCADYVRRDHDRPFCLVASFINPHDICYMAIRDFASSDFDNLLLEKGETELARLDCALERPAGVSDEEFYSNYCPPAPPNLEPQEGEPEAVRMLLQQRAFRWKARQEWPEQRWREHRWAYARLTEMVDRQIGRVVDAVRENGNGDTVVIFTSDHGDHDSSHRMEHKTAFYDEAARVPLIICQPGSTVAGGVADNLACNGLDLIPTVCDYAGLDPPVELEGRSLRPLAEGRAPSQWRDHVTIENEIGLCVVTDNYKYMMHDEGENAEQLMDLRRDPFETRNAAGDADLQNALARHREMFEAEAPKRPWYE
ncbi:MAG: sulfatase-like hydrolase/transferase [Candidatus Brocadiia bacterium]